MIYYFPLSNSDEKLEAKRDIFAKLANQERYFCLIENQVMLK